MINIFKKKPVYKFTTSKTLSTIVHEMGPTDRDGFNNDPIRYVAKHAKKSFRWARKGDSGKEYHYYLDEKHMTYIDLAWPKFAKHWRDNLSFSSFTLVLNSSLLKTVRKVTPNLIAQQLASVQPMIDPLKKGKK